MKLTIKHLGEEVSIDKDSDEQDIVEVIQMFRQLLMGAGFHHDIVKEYLDEV